jgi:hypothetical protein
MDIQNYSEGPVGYGNSARICCESANRSFGGCNCHVLDSNCELHWPRTRRDDWRDVDTVVRRRDINWRLCIRNPNDRAV